MINEGKYSYDSHMITSLAAGSWLIYWEQLKAKLCMCRNHPFQGQEKPYTLESYIAHHISLTYILLAALLTSFLACLLRTRVDWVPTTTRVLYLGDARSTTCMDT